MLENENTKSEKVDFRDLHKGDKDKVKVTPDQSVNELGLSNVPENYQEEVRKMLKRHSHMWAGKLRVISVAKKRIELIPGARPAMSHPYSQGLTYQEFETATISKLLAADETQPSTYEFRRENGILR